MKVLSYWRIAAASGDEQQLSLSVRARNFDHQPAVGEAQHTISTIKDGEPEGSGRATFRPTASGGRLEIAGKAQDGAALQVTIECARFGGIHAEGG